MNGYKRPSYTRPTHTPNYDYETWVVVDSPAFIHHTDLVDRVILFGEYLSPINYIIYYRRAEQLSSHHVCAWSTSHVIKQLTFVGYKYDVICKVREEIHSELLAVMCAPAAVDDSAPNAQHG